MDDRFTYRIISEKGMVDFAATYEKAMSKYRQYAADCERGYSEFVSVIWVDPDTNAEGVVFTYKPGNPLPQGLDEESPIITKASLASVGIYTKEKS